MDIELNHIEARVLGCLVEKEATTPDYYPLTLNALTAACNQKSNRSPVMAVDHKAVVRALDDLRLKHLVWQITTTGARVPKYKHDVPSKLGLSPQELGLLCEMLLRGPQTAGELKTRTSRLCGCADTAEVEQTLNDLIDRDNQTLVVKLPPGPGHREPRYTHLLCGEVAVEDDNNEPQAEKATLTVRAENQRIDAIEHEISLLHTEINNLQQQFAEFKKQFE